jgi:hypothetical protein
MMPFHPGWNFRIGQAGLGSLFNVMSKAVADKH